MVDSEMSRVEVSHEQLDWKVWRSGEGAGLEMSTGCREWSGLGQGLEIRFRGSSLFFI